MANSPVLQKPDSDPSPFLRMTRNSVGTVQPGNPSTDWPYWPSHVRPEARLRGPHPPGHCRGRGGEAFTTPLTRAEDQGSKLRVAHKELGTIFKCRRHFSRALSASPGLSSLGEPRDNTQCHAVPHDATADLLRGKQHSITVPPLPLPPALPVPGQLAYRGNYSLACMLHAKQTLFSCLHLSPSLAVGLVEGRGRGQRSGRCRLLLENAGRAHAGRDREMRRPAQVLFHELCLVLPVLARRGRSVAALGSLQGFLSAAAELRGVPCPAAHTFQKQEAFQTLR